MTRIRITRITFHHFKALRRFTLPLDRTNVLTGANNAGKSTVIGALRVLSAAMRNCKNRPLERLQVAGARVLGFTISPALLTISMENVASDYDDSETSKVSFHLSNGCTLHLYMHHEDGCRLVPESPDMQVDSSAKFKKLFAISLTVVPVLGPLEHEELIVEQATMQRAASTPRASRHFRNYWYYNRAEFSAFAQLVLRTWPGMDLEAPSLENRKLTMFVNEGRLPRELYWVGFGFQIWCQLLTHLHRASDSTLVVIDEPEVYLHPDIQRRLLGVLSQLGPDVLLATHSTEIIAEADPTDLVVIDKGRATAERVRNIAGVQRAMDSLGSQQNITLIALARNRRVLFVEGDTDFPLIRRFARRLNMDDLGAGLGLTSAISGGFGSNSRVRILAEGISEALSMPLMIGAVYDRDYFCDEEIAHVQLGLSGALTLAYILPCKEIENLLLVPVAIQRALDKAVRERHGEGVSALDVESTLRAITEAMFQEVETQVIANHHRWFERGSRDASTLISEAKKRLSGRWAELSTRLLVVPGKQVLRQLRERVTQEHGVSLSDTRIIDSMHQTDVLPSLRELLSQIEGFRKRAIQ